MNSGANLRDLKTSIARPEGKIKWMRDTTTIRTGITLVVFAAILIGVKFFRP